MVVTSLLSYSKLLRNGCSYGLQLLCAKKQALGVRGVKYRKSE